MANEKSLVKVEQKSVESLISQAIKQNIPVESMERILAMRRELRAEHAKEEFDQAMANFQGECPTIKKTKEVKTSQGKTAYKYAPIESIVDQVKEHLKSNGFSYAIKTETLEKTVKSTCIVKHEAGHSEESSMEVPLGGQTQMMSNTQVTAAALTFAKRYAFCNAFGIMTGDDDDDAQATKDESLPQGAVHGPSNRAPGSVPRGTSPGPIAPPAGPMDEGLARASLIVQIGKEAKRLETTVEHIQDKIGKKLQDLGVNGLEQVFEQLKKLPSPKKKDDGIPTISEDGHAIYPGQEPKKGTLV